MKKYCLWSLLTGCLFLSQLAVAQVSGSGTTNYIPIWTSSSALGNSKLYQTGGHVGVGTTSPAWALDVNGNINVNGVYKISGNTVLALPGGAGSQNISVGYGALSNAGTTNDTAVGYHALTTEASGYWNTAIGSFALSSNTSGNNNTAIGLSALAFSTTGNYNVACGADALFENNTGGNNTAVGYEALAFGTALSNNIGVGFEAGYNLGGSESNDVDIANGGATGDNGVIRIGASGNQTSFYAAGIYGASSGSSSAIPVLVDSSGQLVTVSSSRRFKEDIQDMGESSRDLMRLRPVTFRYQKPLDDGSKPIQFGLIAEEVAEVYPDMVAYSADGQVQSVKYQMLDPMLLNEVQRQQTEMERQKNEIQELREQVKEMKAALAAVFRSTGKPIASGFDVGR